MLNLIQTKKDSEKLFNLIYLRCIYLVSNWTSITAVLAFFYIPFFSLFFTFSHFNSFLEIFFVQKHNITNLDFFADDKQ